MRVAELSEGSGLADIGDNEVGRVSLSPLREPQGEGMTFGSDNTMYLMSEGGGKNEPDSFARLTCTLNS